MPPYSLREQAYHIIYEQISAGTLAKGSVTSEVQLSARLDMSRTPVRAALQQLESEGFVRIIPKHGVLVLDTSAQRASDLLEIIAAMLAFAVLIVHQSDPTSLSELSRRLTADLKALLDPDDPATPELLCIFELNVVRDIVALGHNQMMAVSLERIAVQLFWNDNTKRWAAPYRGEMAAAMTGLLCGAASPEADFPAALLRYMHLLKITWT